MSIPNDTRYEDFKKEARKMGEEHGTGAVSRPKFAMRGLEMSVQGVAGPDKAKELWTEFQTGSAKKRGVEYKVEGSVVQQLSKFKKFLTLGQLSVDTIDLMNRTTEIIKELAKDKDLVKAMGGSAYDKMIVVAAAQIKLGNAGVLSDDQIRDLLFPNKKERDEAAELRAIAKKLDKYPSPQAEKAQQYVTDRLSEIEALNAQAQATAQVSAPVAPAPQPNPAGNGLTAQDAEDIASELADEYVPAEEAELGSEEDWANS